MDYGPSDSSGTDDDLPPSHQNRGARGGRVVAIGRPVVNTIQYPRVQNDLEAQIHLLEQEAYSSVLRAFKGQSDAITWEKESLITELRKELRVSDEEHRELLNRVNADDIIRRIREWRSTMLSNGQPAYDPVPSPTVSASHKKLKTSHPVPSLSLISPSPALQHAVASMQPTSSVAKKGTTAGAKGKKPKSGQAVPGLFTKKSMQYPITGPSARGHVAKNISSGALVAIEPAEVAPYDSLIGRKVMTRWPDDNNFYEAIITDYKPAEGLHTLVYDINTKDETWETVNLKEFSPKDIRWEGEDQGAPHRAARSGAGRGAKKSVGRGGSVATAGRGRGSLKSYSRKELILPSQNGIAKKSADNIELLHTETVIKEVERVFASSQPDLMELEKAKRVLKEHEQSLIDAIQRLANLSDGESDEEQQFSHGRSMDRDPGWSYRQFVGGGEGRDSDGDRMVGAGDASNYRHNGDDDDDI